MRKLILVLFFIFSASSFLNAQNYFRVKMDSATISSGLAFSTNDGGCIAFAYSFAPVMLKLDSSGAVQWAQGYQGGNFPSFSRWFLFEDSLGNFFAPGEDWDFLGNFESYNLSKADSAGNYLGFRQGIILNGFEGSSLYCLNFDIIKNRILIVSDYYAEDPSTFLQTAGTSSLIVCNLNFNIVWSKTITTFNTTNPAFEKIFPVYNGNITTAYFLVDWPGFSKLDVNGNIVWRKQFNSGVDILDVVQKDSNYYFLLNEYSYSELIKTDLNGNIVNSVKTLSTDTLHPVKMQMNASGNLVVEISRSPYGKLNILAEVDSGLNIIQSINDSSLSYVNFDLVKGSNDIILSGYDGVDDINEKMNFSSSCNFQPVSLAFAPSSDTISTLPALSISNGGSFTGGIGSSYPYYPYSISACVPTSIEEVKNSHEHFTISPTLTSDILKIKQSNESNSVSCTIYNIQGAEVYKNIFSEKEFSVSLSQLKLKEGMYFVKLNDEHNNFCKKIIKVD